MRRSASEVIRNLEIRIARLEKEALGTATKEYKITYQYYLDPEIYGDTFASKHLLEEKSDMIDVKIHEYLDSKGKVKDFDYIYNRLPTFSGFVIIEARPNTFTEEFEKTFKVKGLNVDVYFEAGEDKKDIEILATIKKPRKVDTDAWEDMLDQGAFYDEVSTLLRNYKVTDLQEDDSDWDRTKIKLFYKGTVKADLFDKLPKRKKLPSGYIVAFKYA